MKDTHYGTAKPVNENVSQAGAVKGQVPDGSFKAAGANVKEGRAATFTSRMGGRGRRKSGGSSHNSMGKDY